MAEWLGRALQKLLQRFESARDLQAKGQKPSLFLIMIRYSKWIGLAALSLIVISCFMPWAYYADVQMTFNGFFSERNIYGKPAKFLILFGVLSAVLAFLNNLWLKRSALLFSGLNVSYAIKNFLLFGACYRGYCPEKLSGIYMMLISTILLFLTTLFQGGKVEKSED